MGGLHAGSGLYGDGQVLDNLPLLLVVDHDRVRVDDALLDAILAVGNDGSGGPLAGGTVVPVVDSVDQGRGSRGSRGEATGGNDGGTALLDGRDEGIRDPLAIEDVNGQLALDGGVVDVGELGGAVVTPDDEAVNVGHLAGNLLGDLRETPVVVEAGHGHEVSSGDGGSIALGDEGVGVSGVADDNDAGVLALTGLVEGLTLDREDLSVLLEEVTALHALSPGLSTNEASVVDALEGLLRVVGEDDIAEGGESAIAELHDDALEGLLHLGELEEVEDHGGLGTEHGTTVRKPVTI